MLNDIVSDRQVGLGTFEPNDMARKYINDILDSGRISYGKYSRELEKKFAFLHESKFGVLSNSGTSSLHVALQAMKELYGWQDGDEVIVPSSTFVATVNVVLHCNLKPVLVDIELGSYGIDPNLIEEKITDRTRCIIPVHAFGQICNMKKVMEIAAEHDLKVIEDSCETMGVHTQEFGTLLMAGSIGHVGCFSFYVAHLITAGVGGIAITSDEELAVKMRSLVNHGRDSIYISIDDDEDVSNEIVEKRFRFTSVGHSFRITELESALALSQIDTENFRDMIRIRNRNADRLTDNISRYVSHIVKPPPKNEDRRHAYMMYPMLIIDPSVSKNDLTLHLEKSGVETRDLLPITNQPVYHDILGIDEKDYPNSKILNDTGFYVGCHQGLDFVDMDYIVDKIIEFDRSVK